MWFGKQLDFGNFKSFGSVVYVHVPKQKRHKLDEKAEKCLFVGYGENIKGYRVYNPSKRTVTTVHDIIFDKNDSKNDNTDKNVCEYGNEDNDNKVIVRISFDEEEENLRSGNAINENDDSINNESLDETVINDNDTSYASESDISVSSTGSLGNETEIEVFPLRSNNFCDVQASNVVDSRTRSGANIASCAFLASTSEPTTYNEAVNDERSEE
ncbi:uncharacterized protein LOC129571247 [Sitodiplosis mosellana]|uniref:uncharacterized protein LOC129571247 n=1 Tax=Sitodiplosis mosellana TaxID=263140 RepID=UPI002444B47E|nr:uncharacterized protein LOC129571247 [Sitodiplosis mosellana]